jgi:hypothetical protein
LPLKVPFCRVVSFLNASVLVVEKSLNIATLFRVLLKHYVACIKIAYRYAECVVDEL